jgi:valyl-tRNA synthetase
VREAFVTLYERGLIYRGNYIVNWDPASESAISDIETDYTDEQSFLWHIAYKLTDGPVNGLDALVVATTRPETLYGDVAVAVNPKDARYSALIGKTVDLPLTGKTIPIIGDDYVEMDFGTGCLKITPAHDPNDFHVGQRHQLDPVLIIDTKGYLMDLPWIPSGIRGLERFEARKATEQLLQDAGLLVDKKEHTNRVGRSQRTGVVVEPLLSLQWFVNTKPMADKCLAGLESGEFKFIPERWTKDYVRWMSNIQDWCISRQLWWGHQIPAWTCCDCGHLTVSRTDPDACPECASKNIAQDPDVLDTWFSSGLWPFSTMGWPNHAASDLKAFYPTDVLVTGFDIIFFWVARMTMMGIELTEKFPFHTIYVHGLIRDEKGQKMSKSKGNTVDPVETIDQLGCDAFRFGLTSLITYGGQDIKLAKETLEQGKLFCNKLWNASRFVLMNLEGVDDQPIDAGQLSDLDRWILSRTHATVQAANEALTAYKFGELCDLLYAFTWNDFCDWYVEYAKVRVQDDKAKANTQRILLSVLNTMLRLWHPIMPFMTDTIWQQLPHVQGKSISVQAYPVADAGLINPELEQGVSFVLEVVRAIRNLRQQYTVPHTTGVSVVLESLDTSEFTALNNNQPLLERFVKLSSLQVSGESVSPSGNTAINIVGQTRVMVSLEGLIDPEAETQRLRKKRETLEKEFNQLNGLLNNAGFMAKAPEEVVAKNRDRVVELDQQLKALDAQLVAFQ